MVQFGYTRKDVLLLGFGIIGFGYALYYGLQGAGVDALVAGNFVQLFVFLGIGVGYISTYLFRVANKVPLLQHSYLQNAKSRLATLSGLPYSDLGPQDKMHGDIAQCNRCNLLPEFLTRLLI